MKISIICAMDEKRGIGKDNKLLWDIPADLKRFRAITSGHPIIMGRKTFESIGRVLPNRTNIIVTHNSSFIIPNSITVSSLEDAFEKAKSKQGSEEVFVIGGGQVFQQALPLASRLYLTIVDGDFEADTFFPDYSMFIKKIFEESHVEGKYRYTFVDLELPLANINKD